MARNQPMGRARHGNGRLCTLQLQGPSAAKVKNGTWGGIFGEAARSTANMRRRKAAHNQLFT